MCGLRTNHRPGDWTEDMATRQTIPKYQGVTWAYSKSKGRRNSPLAHLPRLPCEIYFKRSGLSLHPPVKCATGGSRTETDGWGGWQRSCRVPRWSYMLIEACIPLGGDGAFWGAGPPPFGSRPSGSLNLGLVGLWVVTVPVAVLSWYLCSRHARGPQLASRQSLSAGLSGD